MEESKTKKILSPDFKSKLNKCTLVSHGKVKDAIEKIMSMEITPQSPYQGSKDMKIDFSYKKFEDTFYFDDFYLKGSG